MSIPPPCDVVAARPAELWAEVRARGRVMRYRRSGAGAASVLVCAGASDGLWPELLDALSVHARVIIPELPVDGQIACWLADFLEGLGLCEVSVVAADPYCMAALELALLGADQVTRLLLVPVSGTAEADIEGTLATAAATSAVPLLLIRREQPLEVALPLVLRFLGAGDTAGPP
jgi:hypothetical protein